MVSCKSCLSRSVSSLFLLVLLLSALLLFLFLFFFEILSSHPHCEDRKVADADFRWAKGFCFIEVLQNFLNSWKLFFGCFSDFVVECLTLLFAWLVAHFASD